MLEYELQWWLVGVHSFTQSIVWLLMQHIIISVVEAEPNGTEPEGEQTRKYRKTWANWLPDKTGFMYMLIYVDGNDIKSILPLSKLAML